MGLKDRPYAMWLKDWHHGTKDWPHLTKQKIIVHHVLYIQCTHRWYKVVRVNGLISALYRFLVMQRIYALIYTRQKKCNMLKVRFMPKELGITHFYYKNLNILRLFFSLLFEQYFFFRCILSLMSILYISNQHINNYLYTENYLFQRKLKNLKILKMWIFYCILIAYLA